MGDRKRNISNYLINSRPDIQRQDVTHVRLQDGGGQNLSYEQTWVTLASDKEAQGSHSQPKSAGKSSIRFSGLRIRPEKAGNPKGNQSPQRVGAPARPKKGPPPYFGKSGGIAPRMAESPSFLLNSLPNILRQKRHPCLLTT